METAISIIFQLAILIFSVVIHEVAHGLAANALGDPTAKYAGRLTLNPLKHLDPVGSFLVPLMTFIIPRLFGGGGFIIGWAKPVPYNPYNLKVKNIEFGSAVVGAAGPLSNVTIAIVFGLLVRWAASSFGVLGSATLPIVEIMKVIVLVNLMLAVFNLVPIPPLDGSKVLFSIVPASWVSFRLFLERYGFILLLFFIFNFSGLILPIVAALFRLATGATF